MLVLGFRSAMHTVHKLGFRVAKTVYLRRTRLQCSLQCAAITYTESKSVIHTSELHSRTPGYMCLLAHVK